MDIVISPAEVERQAKWQEIVERHRKIKEDYRAKRFAQIDKIVANHKVTLYNIQPSVVWSECDDKSVPKVSEINQSLTFKHPASGCEAVYFHAVGGTLNISGDYGAASFGVSHPHSLVWWSTCGADYLERKMDREIKLKDCWDVREAAESLEIEIFNLRQDESDETNQKVLAILDCEEAREVLDSAESWREYLESHRDECGDYYKDEYEFHMSCIIGQGRPFEIDRWLYILKKAIARLPEEHRKAE